MNVSKVDSPSVSFVFQNSKSAQGLVGLKNLGNTVSTAATYKCDYTITVGGQKPPVVVISSSKLIYEGETHT